MMNFIKGLLLAVCGIQIIQVSRGYYKQVAATQAEIVKNPHICPQDGQAMPVISPTLTKSEIARLFGVDIRTIKGWLQPEKQRFAYWFSRRKVFFPFEYKPLIRHLQGETPLELLTDTQKSWDDSKTG